MTTVLTRPSALLHTSSDRLRNLFRAVLSHAAVDDPDDPPAPTLTKVHVELRGGDLRLVCSDRYTMGIVRESMTSTLDGFTDSFAVPAEDVRSALDSVDGERAALIVEENTLRIASGGTSEEIPGIPSTLTWRDLLARTLTPCPTPTGRIAFNPTLLSRLQAAKPLAPGTPMLFQMRGEGGAIVATLGEVFLGLVQPINMSSAARQGDIPERPLDVWFDLIDEEPIPAGGAS